MLGLCTNVAPVHAPLYLILLVAVFVCVVPGVQLVLSVLRYSITGSPLFRCAQVSACCDWDVCISHTARRPVIMFLVYQIEARPAVHSHSHLTHTYTHTHAGGWSNTFLAGLRCSCEIRLLCTGVWTTKQGGVKGDLRVSVCLCGCHNGHQSHQPERRNQRTSHRHLDVLVCEGCCSSRVVEGWWSNQKACGLFSKCCVAM